MSCEVVVVVFISFFSFLFRYRWDDLHLTLRDSQICGKMKMIIFSSVTRKREKFVSTYVYVLCIKQLRLSLLVRRSSANDEREGMELN